MIHWESLDDRWPIARRRRLPDGGVAGTRPCRGGCAAYFRRPHGRAAGRPCEGLGLGYTGRGGEGRTGRPHRIDDDRHRRPLEGGARAAGRGRTAYPRHRGEEQACLPAGDGWGGLAVCGPVQHGVANGSDAVCRPRPADLGRSAPAVVQSRPDRGGASRAGLYGVVEREQPRLGRQVFRGRLVSRPRPQEAARRARRGDHGRRRRHTDRNLDFRGQLRPDAGPDEDRPARQAGRRRLPLAVGGEPRPLDRPRPGGDRGRGESARVRALAPDHHPAGLAADGHLQWRDRTGGRFRGPRRRVVPRGGEQWRGPLLHRETRRPDCRLAAGVGAG